jgi:hypothetical protein
LPHNRPAELPSQQAVGNVNINQISRQRVYAERPWLALCRRPARRRAIQAAHRTGHPPRFGDKLGARGRHVIEVSPIAEAKPPQGDMDDDAIALA